MMIPKNRDNSGTSSLYIVASAASQRPPGRGLLASIAFTAGQPGSTDMVITATATSATGPALPVESGPARVVVRE